MLSHNERALIQNILSGNREAFDSLYNTYFHKVYNTIFLKVRDHEVSEDLTQEVFISIIESLGHFEGKSSLLCWIYGITKNTVHNWFRSKRRKIQAVLETEESHFENFYMENDTPLSKIEYQEFLLACNKKLAKIDSESREIFLKKHFDGLSIKEIAKETRKSTGSIKTTLYRTKQLLLEEI